MDYVLQTNISNASIIRLRPIIENVSSSLIYPTGSKQIKSLINDNSDTKFKYYVRKDFTTDLSSSGGTITFSAQLPVGTQRFVTPNENNYILTVLDKGSSQLVENGDIIYIDYNDPDVVQITQSLNTNSQVTAGSFVINLPSNYFGLIGQGGTYPKLKLTSTIEINKAKSRLKTAIKNKRLIIVSSGDRIIPLRGKDYDTDTIEVFSYSDVYNLKYV